MFEIVPLNPSKFVYFFNSFLFLKKSNFEGISSKHYENSSMSLEVLSDNQDGQYNCKILISSEK